MGIIKKSKFPVKEIILTGFLPSFLKKIVYRIKGAKIGKDVHIGLGSVVTGKKVEIGDHTQIGFLTIIRAKNIKIGKYVDIGSATIIDTEKIEIDDDAVITEQVFIGGIATPESYLKIGKRAIIMQMSFLNPTKPLIIGDDAGIGGNCLIFTHGSWQSPLDGYPVKFEKTTIGKNVWLPWRVFVMPGVTIGDNATIGANSLVTKDIPPGALAAGNPAQVIKTSSEYPKKMDEKDKHFVLLDIFNDFIKYLEYNHFSVKATEINDNLNIIINKPDTTQYNIIYISHEDESLNKFVFSDNFVIVCLVNIDDNKVKSILSTGAMLINIFKKERKGSTGIGEELIMFFKRYGMRFDRA